MTFEVIKGVINDNLSGDFVPDFLLFEEVTSTNDVLKDIVTGSNMSGVKNSKDYIENIPSCINEGFSVISLSQTKGKGRRGRSFFSPPECSVYLSVLLRPDISVEEIQVATPMAAVAVHNAVNDVCRVNSGIKWVNDIYLNNKKICGILTEASVNANNPVPEYVIVGIGVNVFYPKCAIPKEIENIYGTIFDEHVTYDDNIIGLLAASIINNLMSFYKSIHDKSFLDEYRKSLMFINKYVTYVSGNERKRVLVKGIDDNLHLIVEDETCNILILRDGEVSLDSWEI